MRVSNWHFFVRLVAVTILLISASSPTWAANNPKPNALSGFIDLNFYYDTRDQTVVTINNLVEFPYRFEYFSLINYTTPLNTTRNADITTFYSEHHFRWNPFPKIPLDMTMLWTLQSGTQNDTLHFGLRFRATDLPWWNNFFDQQHFVFWTNFHPLEIELTQSPGHGWIIEHVWLWDIFPELFDNRLYMNGSVDHVMRYGGGVGGNNHYFVVENQLGVRMVDWLYAVAEYRHNDFLTEQDGVSLGLQYKIVF